MEFKTTRLPGVLLVIPTVFEDPRGFFMETYRAEEFLKAGIPKFVQENHSKSHKGVLRGIHYQIKQAQGKLVRAVEGEIFDVAVDLRRSSKHFGKWFGVMLSAQNKHMLWVPAGFGHGFYTMSKAAQIVYKATDYYAPKYERSVLWNDPKLGICWPGKAPILSPKDAAALPLSQAEVYD